MFNFTLIIATVVILLTGVVSADANDTFGYLHEYPRPGSLKLYINKPSKKISCRFIAPSSLDGKNVSSVYVYPASVAGNPPSCYAGLQADVDGLPSGTWLGRASFVPSSTGSFIKVSIPSCKLSGGKAYHLVVQYDQGQVDDLNYAAFSYTTSRTRSDVSVLTDYGSGWIRHSSADPCFVIECSDGTLFGQPYTGSGEQRIFGSGIYSGFGQQVVLDEEMSVRRISFMMRVSGKPSAPCRVAIKDMTTGAVIADEVFCTVASFSRSVPYLPNFYWIAHDLSSAVTLSAGRPYLIWLYQQGYDGDTNNCYRIYYSICAWNSPSFLHNLTWRGPQSCAGYINSPAGAFVPWRNTDCIFRLDTSSVGILYQHVTGVKDTSATIVFKTSIATDAAVEFGETDYYGCGEVSFGKTRHEITLTSLQPGKTYHYRIIAMEHGNLQSIVYSADSVFRVPRTDDTVAVGIIGDTQQLMLHCGLRQVLSREDDLLLTVGDNLGLENDWTGVNPTFAESILEWEQFLGLIKPAPCSPAFYLAVGNHDSTIVPAARQAWQDELTLPTNGNSELYYSFDYGPAHFTVLDPITFLDGYIDTAQLNWLRSDLASTSKPWKIVVVHLVIRGDSWLDPYRHWWTLKNADAVHEILVQHGVRLVLQGHTHTYNRYRSDGIFYVTNSTLHMETPKASFADEIPGSGFPSYANTGGESGTIPATINLSGSTRLVISPKQIKISFIDAAERIMDQFHLAPQEFSLTWPSEGAVVSSATPVMSWSPSSDDGSGMDRYELWIDGQVSVERIAPGWNSCIPLSPLSPGTHTWTVAAVNRAGTKTFTEASSFVVSPGSDQDTTPPANPTAGYGYSDPSCSVSVEQNRWYVHDRPYFLWNGASDDGSGVAGYYVYFGMDPQADPVSSGVFQSGQSYSAPLLQVDGKYYLRIRAVDARGNTAQEACQVFIYCYDVTPPTIPGTPWTITATDDATPTWQWAASTDSGSGVAGYYIEVTTESIGSVITNTFHADDADSWVQSPPLGSGRYLCRVAAVSGSGVRSEWSPAGTVHVYPQGSIAFAKTVSLGTQVTLSQKVVTAVFDDCAYVEEPDRSCGIRVNGSLGVSMGRLASFSASAGQVPGTGERTAEVVLPDIAGADAVVDPLLVTQYQLFRGVSGVGMDPTGLLVCVVGKVTGLAPDGFYISDGSKPPPNCPDYKGIYISTAALASGSFAVPREGDRVRVVGITARSVSAQVLPFVRCRVPSDISILAAGN